MDEQENAELGQQFTLEEEADDIYSEGDGLHSFMGFDMDIPRADLLATIEAWQGYIERMSKEAERDPRAATLVSLTLLRCGAAYCVLQDWEAAERTLEQVRNTEGALPLLVLGANWLLSTVYAGQGQYERTIACWSAILEDYEATGTKKSRKLPEQVTRLYLYRAQVYAELGRYAEAIGDCDRARVYYPQWAEVYSVRGLSYAYLGDMERALADCDHSIELEPAAARCYRRRGVAHTRRGDYLSAISDFDRALELDPADELAKQGRLRALSGCVFSDLFGRQPGPERADMPEEAQVQAVDTVGKPDLPVV